MAQLLKKRRLELGKNINEAAEITRIKESYLKAIEEEDFSKLPIEVYTKGYIREYAKFLGVYAEDIITKYDRYLDEKKGIKGKAVPVEAGDKSPKIEDAEERAGHKGPVDSAKTIPATESSGPEKGPFSKKALLVLPLLVIIIAAYFLMPSGNNVPPVPQETVQKIPAPVGQIPAPVLQIPEPEKVQPDNQVAPQKPSEKAEEKKKVPDVKAKSENAVQPKKNSLDIKATDKVWLQIIIDGSEKKEITLNAGDRIVYGANKSFNILVGNAAGVVLKYNDKNFQDLGEKGQVVRLNLPEMTAPQVVSPNNSEIPSELPKSQTPNNVKQ